MTYNVLSGTLSLFTTTTTTTTTTLFDGRFVLFAVDILSGMHFAHPVLSYVHKAFCPHVHSIRLQLLSSRFTVSMSNSQSLVFAAA